MKKRLRRYKIRYKRVFFAAAILFSGISFLYLLFHPVLLKASTIEVEINSEFKPEDQILFVLGDDKEVKIDGEVDTSKLGEYTINYKFHQYQKEVKIKVQDTKAPSITTKNLKTDMIQDIEPASFIEKCEDATEVTYHFANQEDFSKPGRYEVPIIATDQGKNETRTSAILKRCEDKQGPTIEHSDKKIEFKQGLLPDFLEDVSIKDDFDENPSLDTDTSQVNFDQPGDYTLIYIGRDRSGNETQKTRSLTILKNEELNQKIVYLTFDDGPSKNTERILKILDQYDVKATFFVTGNQPSYNDWLKVAHEKGHTIGLHTFTHDFASVYSSTDAYYDDLQKIQDMVKDITSEEVKLVRFPGGSSNTISKQYLPKIMTILTKSLQDKGYQYFDWNCDSGDASGNNIPADTLIQNATACQSQYINILMHDTAAKDTTVEALPKIIEHYKSEGYVFKAIEIDSFAPHHGVNN